MQELWTKLSGGAPELVATVGIVWLFLNFMRDRDRAMEHRDLLFINSIRSISDQHVEAREQSKRVIELNSIHTLEATKAIGSMTEVLRGIEARMISDLKPKKVDSPLQQG
jgi:hypothetical protein